MDWRQKIKSIVASGEVRWDEPMTEHTTFRIGGPAEALVIPGNREELRRVLDFAVEHELPRLVLGRGSNLLVRDGGFPGLVVKTGSCLRWMDFAETSVRVGAGIGLMELACEAAAHKLAGLAFAAGIPGTLGGGIFMNAGAYGGEMAQVVVEVAAYYPGEGERILPADQLRLGYRSSRFQSEEAVIEEALLQLKPGDTEEIKAEMAACVRRRQEKQPLSMPSAGSVFKRPPGGYAGTLIDQAGLKGATIGRAQVSPLHANFIVNLGGASARDVLALIDHVRRKVASSCGVVLEPEIKVIGRD